MLLLFNQSETSLCDEISPVPYFTNKNIKMYRCHMSILLGVVPAVSVRLQL